MLPIDHPALQSGIRRAVDVFCEICEKAAGIGTPPDILAFHEFLAHPRFGLPEDERQAIRKAGDRCIVAAIWHEISKRQAQGRIRFAIKGRLPEGAPQ